MQRFDSSDFPDLLNIPDSKTFFKELGDWLSSSIQSGISGSIAQIATTVVLGIIGIIVFFTIVRILKASVLAILKSSRAAKAEQRALDASNAAFRDTVHVLHSDDIVRKKLGDGKNDILKKMGVKYIDKSELVPRSLNDLLASARVSVQHKAVLEENLFSDFMAPSTPTAKNNDKLVGTLQKLNRLIDSSESRDEMMGTIKNFTNNEGKILRSIETRDQLNEIISGAKNKKDIVKGIQAIQQTLKQQTVQQVSTGLYGSYIAEASDLFLNNDSVDSATSKTSDKGSKAPEENIFAQYL